MDMRKLIVILLALALVMLASPAPAQTASRPQPPGLRHDLILNGKRVHDSTTTRSAFATPPTVPGYHFPRSSGTQTYVRVIYASTDTRWKATTERAVVEWGKSSRIAMVMASSCPTWTPQRNCVIVRVRNDGPNGILGTAVVWANDHVVSPSTHIVFNSYYNTGRDLNLPCHEIGHTLGLGHPPDGTQGPCVNVPRAEDYTAVRKLYAHTDGSGPPGV